MSDYITSEFPVWGLLPKKETGVTQFLAKYPEYDGRGVIIAIFDSGVDPGAAGLRTTTDGKIKVIERFDCSGAGDVDTSTVASAVDGIITGVTGRKLKIPDHWENPSEIYHIGVKNSFELYPPKVLERVKKERKDKLWDLKHKAAIAAATRKLGPVSSNGESSTSSLEKLKKEDKEAELELLTTFEKKFVDLGPSYDCVVFHDGTCWRACIDTSETGDLASGVLLGEYSITHDFAPLTELDQLNVSINVYNDGSVLEIVSMCSAHGTHVASIAAAHFPNEPEKNGVAPGAQIISLTIGDSRLTSMETGMALVRAMIKVMQRPSDSPVHVINMSYGEHAHWSSSGRLGELMVEVVGKHKVTWIGSAGNHGPALCTIGTPPDISTDCIIGVGAYVSPDMMAAEYAMLEKLPGMPYTWSSRGPTIDGGVGVSVCAPGGAITSVPNFTLRGAQLMNGTSMAAPHVAGAVAVLMSGLMQKGYKFSPYSVRRALENTANFLPDLDQFAQGYGLLQVEKAFEHLCEYRDVAERDVLFAVQCGSSNAKGIHLRSGQLDKPKENHVTVDPVFHELAAKREMIDFNMRLNLVCSAPWVQMAAHLDLSNMARSLTVRIDPAGLTDGVHSTSIRAYDTACVGKGPVFQIPVTAVKPIVPLEASPDLIERGVLFKPNTIRRHFVLVPERASWVVLRMRCPEKDKSGKFILHCVQLLPKQVCKTLEFHKMFILTSSSDIVQAFPARGGLILEVVVAKFWSSLVNMVVDYEVEFRGAKPDCPFVTMQGADSIHTIEISSGVRTEEIVPAISLKSSVLVLRPSESKVTACCGERDVVPPARQIYENILTYNVHIWKACEVTPSCPLLSDLLYESEFESQLWMIYDVNKQLIASGDAYPSKYSVKLEKGDYVIRLDVRHERRDLLEKLSDTPLLLSQKLCQAIAMDVYISQAQAMIQGKKMAGAVIPPGHHILPIYIGSLTQDKATKNVPFGHYLQGTISYAKDELGKKADVYKFKYIMPEASKKNKSESKDKDKDKTKTEEFDDAMRDFSISWLAKLEPGEKADELYEKLKVEFPDNLQVHTSMLLCLDPVDLKRFGVLPFFTTSDVAESKLEELRATCQSVITICDQVISSVDATQLLSHLGIKMDGRPEASKAKQVAEKQKAALVEALARKGCALARLATLDGGEETDTLDAIWREIVKFVDPNDLKVVHLMLWHAVISRQFSRALRFLAKMAEDKPSRELELKAGELCRQLGWDHIDSWLQRQLPTKYPAQYRRF